MKNIRLAKENIFEVNKDLVKEDIDTGRECKEIATSVFRSTIKNILEFDNKISFNGKKLFESLLTVDMTNMSQDDLGALRKRCLEIWRKERGFSKTSMLKSNEQI